MAPLQSSGLGFVIMRCSFPTPTLHTTLICRYFNVILYQMHTQLVSDQKLLKHLQWPMRDSSRTLTWIFDNPSKTREQRKNAKQQLPRIIRGAFCSLILQAFYEPSRALMPWDLVNYWPWLVCAHLRMLMSFFCLIPSCGLVIRLQTCNCSCGWWSQSSRMHFADAYKISPWCALCTVLFNRGEQGQAFELRGWTQLVVLELLAHFLGHFVSICGSFISCYSNSIIY